MSPRAAVLGHPISHSKSPQLHLAAYQELGLDWAYTREDLVPETLGEFMAQVTHSQGWRGLSVTMPLKSAVVDYLDVLHGPAESLGVVNTVVVNEDGTRHGHNTDIRGIVNSLLHASGGSPSYGVHSTPPARHGSAAVLGGGGTSAAAVAALAQLGLGEVTLFVRDPARAGEALRAAEVHDVTLHLTSFDKAGESLPRFDTVVSTLPPHAADSIADVVRSAGGGTAGALLLDVAYDPWPSALASAWQRSGAVVIPGLEMLLYQAVEQVLLFTGVSPDLGGRVTDVMCAAVNAPAR